MDDAGDVKVSRNDAQSRFEATVDGEVALAEYERDGDVMALTHTIVPPALEGRGIAKALIRTALEHARREGWKVRPDCSYARAYMDRHPDTKDLRA